MVSSLLILFDIQAIASVGDSSFSFPELSPFSGTHLVFLFPVVFLLDARMGGV
jgi:hypothetical protein